MGGVPPGEKRFNTQSGIGPHVWKNRIWRTWGDALSEAGYSPLEWVKPHDDAELLSAVLELAKRLGRFPNSSDLQFEGANNPSFPSYGSFKRRWRMVELAPLVEKLAIVRADETVAAYCRDFLATVNRPSITGRDDAAERSKMGHVYLISYGKDYKIGRTSSVVRRSRQVQLELPNETVLIHAILTDDPVGVEAYWHRRFADRRGNGQKSSYKRCCS